MEKIEELSNPIKRYKLINEYHSFDHSALSIGYKKLVDGSEDSRWGTAMNLIREWENSYIKPRILSKEGADLLINLLNPNPKERMKFVNEKLMNHSWFSNSSTLFASHGIKTVDEWWKRIQNKTIAPTNYPVFYLGKECIPYSIFALVPNFYSLDLLIKLRESSKIASIMIKEDDDGKGQEAIKSKNTYLPIILSLPKGMIYSDFHDISNFLICEQDIESISFEIVQSIIKKSKKSMIENEKHFIITAMDSKQFFEENHDKDDEILMNKFEKLENQILDLYKMNIPFITKIVGIYIFGPFLLQIFESVPGRSLSSLCKNEKPLNESDLIFYIGKLIICIKELHPQRIS